MAQKFTALTLSRVCEDWAGHNAGFGYFQAGSLTKVLNNVVLIKGLFEKTLPSFREQMPDNIAATLIAICTVQPKQFWKHLVIS